ncbi:MAG: LuxR family transcriptional regulator [Burkholderiaceae bacterium]|nr:MAG: LuxR family transcriptional regulator [Burkholderiaceae bacterium]
MAARQHNYLSDPALVREIQVLLECQSVDELYKYCRHITALLGYEHFLYGVRTSGTSPREFVLSGYPKEWREHYIQQHYEMVDPTLLHSIRSYVPLHWSVDLMPRETGPLFEEAHDFGLKAGLSLPLHGANIQVAMLSLSSSAPAEKLQEHIVSTMPVAQLFSSYLHEAALRLVLEKEEVVIAAPHLTPRELECLKWAMLGKTAWETGRILSISERTVVFHLENAKNKLDVHTTRQAIARALSLGLMA